MVCIGLFVRRGSPFRRGNHRQKADNQKHAREPIKWQHAQDEKPERDKEGQERDEEGEFREFHG